MEVGTCVFLWGDVSVHVHVMTSDRGFSGTWDRTFETEGGADNYGCY